MRLVPAGFGGIGWLAVAVLVLVPLLAVLQYRWLGQVSDSERDRMQRTLATAAQQLAHDFETEIGRAINGLWIDATTIERRAWGVVAHRYDAWAASAMSPRLVNGIYVALLPATEGAKEATLLAWDMAGRTFTDTPWTGPLAAVRPVLESHAPRHADQGATRFDRRAAAIPSDMLVSPIVRVPVEEAGVDVRMGRGDATLLGFAILTLDNDVLGGELLPALVRRHLSSVDGTSEYRSAVIDRENPLRVLYESEPGAAAVVSARHDASVDLVGAVPPGRAPARMLVSVLGTADARTVQTRFVDAPSAGAWRLLVSHQSGSLEAAVAAVRRRNVALSSSILLLLTVAIALIARSARSAHALARQQKEFVAVVTHELRTPVAVINSTAGNLADGIVERPEDVKTYGAMIQGEARRLAETVERVLQLAGLESGNGRSLVEIISPEALVRDAIDACEPEISRLGAQVEVDVAPGLPPIAGDPAALRSAVRNLIENACKYSNEPRWVRVRAWTGATAADVRISVEDRGFGIAAVDRPHVFEPFYRGREVLARQIQGSGLGLSLVARIAEAHGGRVTLESEPGRGTLVTLHLRGAPPAPQGETVPAADRVSPAHGVD